MIGYPYLTLNPKGRKSHRNGDYLQSQQCSLMIRSLFYPILIPSVNVFLPFSKLGFDIVRVPQQRPTDATFPNWLTG